MDDRQQGVAFYGKIDAHDILVRLLAFECQRHDPQFAERCRKALDTALGKLRAENYPNDLDPLAVEITGKTRTIIREILDVAENADAEMRKALASVKPLTLRRRILNWFERG
jgi:hypothetical protein